jgi:CheY-like chemotaxis protein
MDLRMPNLNGFEATKLIREINSEYAKNIPIIAMTADAFQEDQEKCIEAGMNAHLAKPIDETLLLKTLRHYCKKRG